MNTATKAALRKAAIEAIDNQEDIAAMELLGLLAKDGVIDKPALPPARQSPDQLLLQIIDGPARTYHYWAAFIRESFLPFVVASGRARFTSSELFSWIQNNPKVQMTDGDLVKRIDGREHWRGIVTDALKSLKECGIICAAKGGRVYAIPLRTEGE